MSELTIALTSELERRLTAAATRVGVPVEEYVAGTLESVVPPAGSERAEEDSALLRRYAEAGIAWNGRKLAPRVPVAQTRPGASVAQQLLDDRR